MRFSVAGQVVLIVFNMVGNKLEIVTMATTCEQLASQ